jgi:hypothetical protein
LRNPGSSDPVPINDQARLLELTTRGTKARVAAEELAHEMLSTQLDHSGRLFRPTEKLVIAATGITAGFSERLFSSGRPTQIGDAVWGPTVTVGSGAREWRRGQWLQHHAAIERHLHQDERFWEGEIVGVTIVSRRGAVVVYRGNVPRNEDEDQTTFTESELRGRFSEALTGARNLLLDLGAHGDLRLAYRIYPMGRNMLFDGQPEKPWARNLPHEVPVATWTDFDEDVTSRVFEELARAGGIGPLAPGESA